MIALLISSARLVSASWCLTPWNEPIGRPNAMRSWAYCTVISKSWSIAPTDSAATSVAATASWRASSSSAAPARPTTADAVDPGPVEAHLGERAG